MSIVEVPRSFKYTCDVCANEHTQENAGGHYTNSIPPYWSHLKFVVSVEAEGLSASNIDLLLCNNCTGAAAAKIHRLTRREFP